MATIKESWNAFYETRNGIILLQSAAAAIIVILQTNFPHIIDPNYLNLAKFSILFFIAVFLAISFDWMNTAKSIEAMIMMFSVIAFFLSIIIAIVYNDSNIIVGGATIVLVVITGYNIFKTTEIANIQIKIQNEPIIVLNAKENDNNPKLIDLIIENVGSGVGKNIKFSITPHDFIAYSGIPLEKLFFFQNGIQTLSPKQNYIIHLTYLPAKIMEIRGKYKSKDNAEFRDILMESLKLNFLISYDDIFNNKKINQFEIHLGNFLGIGLGIENILSE